MLFGLPLRCRSPNQSFFKKNGGWWLVMGRNAPSSQTNNTLIFLFKREWEINETKRKELTFEWNWRDGRALLKVGWGMEEKKAFLCWNGAGNGTSTKARGLRAKAVWVCWAVSESKRARNGNTLNFLYFLSTIQENKFNLMKEWIKLYYNSIYR